MDLGFIGGVHYPSALYFPADSFDTSSSQVIGRRVAGRMFLQALATSLKPAELLTVFSPGDFGSSVGAIRECLSGTTADLSRIRVGSYPKLPALLEIGALHIPDPILERFAYLRQSVPATAFSLIGITHTICSDEALAAIANIPLLPVYAWDAIICTSEAARASLQLLIEHRLDSLLARFDLGSSPDLKIALPQLPVIPLPGPVGQLFHQDLPRVQRRLLARKQLSIPEEAFVAAYVGRLSFHSKCHPLSLYQALEAVATRNPTTQVVLIECGHIYSDWIARAYEDMRSRFPAIDFRLVGGLAPASELDKWRVLAAADVFSSPSDNLQETFGISLLEAMAAELPLIVSDWSGYRDIVENGVTGYLIPASDILLSTKNFDDIESSYRLGFISYDEMIALRASGVALDGAAFISAFQRLHDSPELRTKMGVNSLRRFEKHFSIKSFSESYRSLCASLSHARHEAGAMSLRCALPAMFPYLPPAQQLFPGFASRVLTVQVSDESRAFRVDDPLDILQSFAVLEQLKLLSGDRLDDLLRYLSSGSSLCIGDLGLILSSVDRVKYVLAALQKLGLLTWLDTPRALSDA